MSEVKQLCYLGFGVSDLDAWRDVGTRLLGLVEGRELAGGGFTLRHDEYANRFFVTPDPSDDLLFVGLEVADADAVAALGERLAAHGVDSTPLDDATIAARQVEGGISFQEPGGVRFEAVYGPAKAGAFSSPVCTGGFKTGDLGLGHFVLRADDMDTTLDFLLNGLGFRLSDRIICDIGGYHVNIAFTHCNPRHHSIAVGGNLPKHIHHFMLEANEIDDVGKCWDRIVDAGLPVWNAIGRHPNDRMISFYAETPSGFQFEYGWGGLEILNDDEWNTFVYDRISDWGHEHPAAMCKKLFRRQKESS
ncbi:MAG: biphenyl 2,3-dioxygenase [Candidatus Dadabacteria bacterium]|nr:MAG: biphenyl 2,3-dioxygenase [Candidatus Dadabacteria bacterium]